MASYNEIISILDQFATAHYQIKAFGNGEMDELVETFSLKDAEYPKMWANDQPNTTATGEETFKFRIYMVDQVATLKQKTDTTLGESNINEVKSNTRQMCLDLVSFLIQNTIYPEITTDRNIQLTSFVDSFNDKLTGWYFDLDIRQALSFSACVIPMTGILPPPSTTCEPAIININGTFFINVPSGSTENIDVKDTNGLAVGSEVGGEWIVPPAGAVCDDAIEIITDSASNVLYTNVIPSGDTETQIITDSTVTNSDASYNVNILAQGSLVLPDVINIDSDGTPITTPSQTPFTCTPSALVKNSAPIIKTGATVSYQTGDDGDLQTGRDVDLFTLDHNNGFGNTNTYTDDLGTQVFATDIIIDWSTADYTALKVRGWYRIPLATNRQDTFLSGQPYTINSLSGWLLPNYKQLVYIFNLDTYKNWINYAPFNIDCSINGGIWTSNRHQSNRATSMTTAGVIGQQFFSVNARTILTKEYTFTELGL
jgi:hypothetical protein